MIEALRVAFPQIDAIARCHDVCADPEFYIFDHDELKRCFIQTELDGIRHFTVENPLGKDIHFLAIDKVIFMDDDANERCDCAVFDRKTFCFVEIKIVEATIQRTEANRKAIRQLKNTILYFQDRVDFTTKRIEAYVCVGETARRPDNLAKNLDKRLEFQEETGATLYYSNIKRFSK